MGGGKWKAVFLFICIGVNYLSSQPKDSVSQARSCRITTIMPRDACSVRLMKGLFRHSILIPDTLSFCSCGLSRAGINILCMD